MIKGKNSLRNLIEMPSEPIAFNVMPMKAARDSLSLTCRTEQPASSKRTGSGGTVAWRADKSQKKSAKSSALKSNEEKSDESQKPILRKFYQSTFGGNAGSNFLPARRAARKKRTPKDTTLSGNWFKHVPEAGLVITRGTGNRDIEKESKISRYLAVNDWPEYLS
jgi:hypothetical protein